jgi:hypothetical protein
MTVPTEAYKNTLAWTGVETSFAPGFRALATSHVIVTLIDEDDVETVLADGVNLTLALDADGVVSAVPISIPALGDLRFERATPAVQATNFADLASYTAAVHTRLHDAAAMRAAELKGRLAELGLVVADEAAADAVQAANVAAAAAVAAEAARAAAVIAKLAAEAAAAAINIPSIGGSDALKVLRVNAGLTAIEFRTFLFADLGSIPTTLAGHGITDAEGLGLMRAVRTVTDNETLALTDAGKTVEMNAATAKQILIPTNAAIAFPLLSYVNCVRYGAGALTIKGDTGVTLNGVSAGTVTLTPQYGGAMIYKRATNEWVAPNYTAV